MGASRGFELGLRNETQAGSELSKDDSGDSTVHRRWGLLGSDNFGHLGQYNSVQLTRGRRSAKHCGLDNATSIVPFAQHLPPRSKQGFIRVAHEVQEVRGT